MTIPGTHSSKYGPLKSTDMIDTHLIKISITYSCNSFMAEVSIIKKPAHQSMGCFLYDMEMKVLKQ